MSEEIKYSQAIEKVEAILAKLSSEDCDIDTLGEDVKTATELLAMCKKKLHKVEQDLEQIIG